MRYIPHSAAEIEQMLQKIEVKSVDELFNQIPKQARFEKELELPAPLTESELVRHLKSLSKLNNTEATSFLGCGNYNHFVPAAVDQLLLRSEFYTAYTPYQPEISQGTLQAIFEFQSTVCRIFDQETANASMYDGATALTEAALMARRVTKQKKVVVSKGVHPEYIETLNTYLQALDGDDSQLVLVDVDNETGITDLKKLKDSIDDETAAVIVGYPNFYGVVEPVGDIVEMTKDLAAKTITSTLDPFAFGLLTPPGTLGVDIATAEGQAISTSPSFGGPGIGLFAIKNDKKLLRQMPGRLVGKTVDSNDETGFVLTLSTREQHIRREKATSNICTNHGLIALSTVINTSLLGPLGYEKIALASLSLCEYFKSCVAKLDNFEIAFSGQTFNEVLVTSKKSSADNVLSYLSKNGVHGGVSLSSFYKKIDDKFIVSFTETLGRDDIDNLVFLLGKYETDES